MSRTRLSVNQATTELATDEELAQAISTAISEAELSRVDNINAQIDAKIDDHLSVDSHQMYPMSMGARPVINVGDDLNDGETLIFDAITDQWVNGNAQLGHGWPGRTDSTMSYDPLTRTLTLSQAGGVTYWYKGRKVIGPEVITAQHSVVENEYYFMFDDASANLKIVTSSWDLDEHIPTCFVYWSGTDGVAWEERHGHQRNIATHKYLHHTQGTKLVNGMLLSGYTLEDGSNISKVQWALSSGTIADEDIMIVTAPVNSAGPYLLFNRDANNPPSWMFSRDSVIPYKYGTTIQYDNAGVPTDLVHGQYVNYWVYGATKLVAPHAFAIMGQVVHPTLDHALSETLTGLDLSGLPAKECVPIYKVTFRCDNSYTTPGKACIFFVDVIDLTYKKAKQPVQYIDLIATKEPAAPTLDHLSFYAQSRAGRLLPHWVENNGLESAIQPALFGNNVVMWTPNNGTTVSIAFGASFVNRNTGGGGSGQTTPVLANANAVTQMKRAAFNTGTSSTGSAGVQTTAVVTWRGNQAGLGGFFFFARFALEAYVPSERLIIGLSELSGSLSVQPSTLPNTIALVKDSDDATLQIVCSNDTVSTKTDTGITPAVDQILDLILYCKPNDVKVYVRIVDPITGIVYMDNVELSNTLPNQATFMNIQAQIQSTLGSTPKILSINRLYLETNT